MINAKTIGFFIVALTPILLIGQGAFLDMDTEQFGVYYRHEVSISKKIHIAAGIRHQKNLTRGDLMLGRYYDVNELRMGLHTGVSFPFDEFPGAEPHITALFNIIHPIGDKLGLNVHYQPTLNHSQFEKWQHQIGLGLYYKF